ncbi:MAG: Uma2 family endonuclease, partial [Bacteroidota bacterium]
QSHRYKEAHPKAADILLCIEVADSSLDYDRGIKTSLYEEASIPEYWTVNLIDKQVEIVKELKKGVYTFKEIKFAEDSLSWDAFGWEIPLSLIFK